MRFWTRKSKQFMLNEVDHSPGGTSISVTPITYTGMKASQLRAGDVVEVVKRGSK